MAKKKSNTSNKHDKHDKRDSDNQVNQPKKQQEERNRILRSGLLCEQQEVKQSSIPKFSDTEIDTRFPIYNS